VPSDLTVAQPINAGHVAYNSGDTCVQSLVNAYFLDGTVPANNATCT
jgi:TAP-like protein.